MEDQDRSRLAIVIISILFVIIISWRSTVVINQKDKYIKELESYKYKAELTLDSLSNHLSKVEEMSRTITLYDVLFR